MLAPALLSLLGCPAPPEPVAPRPVPVPPPPDREVGALVELLTAVGVEWALLVEPLRLAELVWLKAAAGRVLDDERFDALAVSTGVDVRRCPELALVGYGEDTIAYFVRHPAEVALVERRFRDRLTRGQKRKVWDHQLVTVWGQIGEEPHGYVGLGTEVSGFQYGGEERKGPMTIAALYALGKLTQAPHLLAEPAMQAAEATLGARPLRFLLRGPFLEAKGLRGLLSAAEALAVALEPTDRETIALSAVLVGDYGTDRERAEGFLSSAWSDVTSSDLGHLLGLHEPARPSQATLKDPGLHLEVELRPKALFAGLAAATMDDARTFLR